MLLGGPCHDLRLFLQSAVLGPVSMCESKKPKVKPQYSNLAPAQPSLPSSKI